MSVLVTQSSPTLCNPMDYSLPGSSVHGILQAGILAWVAILFSRGSSRPRDWTWVSHIADLSLPCEPPEKPYISVFWVFFFFFFFFFSFFWWALVRVGSSSLRREWTCPHPALEVQGPLDCQGSPDLCAFSHRKYFDLVLLFVNLPLEITSHLWSWGYRAGGSKTRMLCFGKIPVGSGSLNCFIWLVFKA